MPDSDFFQSSNSFNIWLHLNGEPLHRSIGLIKDLGICFDSKLKFDCHITNVVNRLNKILGFIRRNCANFDDSLALKSIYCSLVCEYDSIIWSLYQSGHKYKIEKIQHRFLQFLSFKCSIARKPYSSYNPLLTTLNLKTLEQHCLRLDLYFSYKLFTGNIDCSEVLSLFSFHVPTRISRSKNTFYLNTEVTNYASNTPHHRIMKTINKLKIDLLISPNFNLFKIYCNFILVNL